MAAKRKSKGAYMISAVAEMYEIHPQTLRLYEREGLLKPSRTEGNTRLYTDEDLERLEFILNLARDLGVNIAGIAHHPADARAHGRDEPADAELRGVRALGDADALSAGGAGLSRARSCRCASRRWCRRGRRKRESDTTILCLQVTALADSLQRGILNPACGTFFSLWPSSASSLPRSLPAWCWRGAGLSARAASGADGTCEAAGIHAAADAAEAAARRGAGSSKRTWPVSSSRIIRSTRFSSARARRTMRAWRLRGAWRRDIRTFRRSSSRPASLRTSTPRSPRWS